MTAMKLADKSERYEAPKSSDHNTMQRQQRNRSRAILLLVIAIVSALGVIGWALQSRSAAQESAGPAATTLPIYESTLATVPEESPQRQNKADTSEATAPLGLAPTPEAMAESEALVPASTEITADEPVMVAATGAPATAGVTTERDVTTERNVTSTQFTQRAVVRAGGAALRARPDGASVTALTTGTALEATARTADSDWIFVTLDNGAEGWIAAEQIVLLNGNLLPVTTAANDEAPDDEAADDEAVLVTGTAVEEEAPPTLTDRQAAIPDGDAMMGSVVLNGSRLNVRSGPGTNYDVVGKAYAGDQYRLVGRNSDGAWVQIAFPTAEGVTETSAWVSTLYIAADGNVADLPIVAEGGNEAPGNPAPVHATAPATAQRATAAVGTGLRGNLIFQSGNGGPIHVYNLDTGNLRTLTTGHDPVVSPDGATVAFTRYDDAAGLYLIGIDGSNERRIFGGRELVSAPSWSADGEWILFSHLIGGFSCRDVGFSICLPDNPFLNDYDLVEKPAWGLARVNRNGEAYRDLPALNTAYAADWSDGGIVYQAATGLEITYDSPDYEGYALFNQQVGYQDPAWQPGGGRIAFQEKGADHTEIWAANADGSGLIALTRPATTLVDQLPSNVAPAWSPDGEQIVYLSNRDDEEEASTWRLWVMDADGSNKRPLPIDVGISYEFGQEQVVSWGRQV